MTISLVQAQVASSGNATSVTTPSMTTTTGNLMVAQGCDDGSRGAPSISDSKGNGWTNRLNRRDAGASLALFVSEVNSITGGSAHTFQYSVSGGAVIAIIVVEISGQATTAVFDQTSDFEDTAGATSHTSNNAPTTTQANELLLGCYTDICGIIPTNETITAGTSFTIPTNGKQESQNGMTGAIESQVVTATGAYAATVTTSAVFSSWTAILTYKEAAVAATPYIPTRDPIYAQRRM